MRTSAPSAPVRHYFTVDVEEYFHVSAFERHVSRADWTTLPSRLEMQLEYLLDLLKRHQSHGTFFTLGWVASRYPRLVRAIVDDGHEIASHGYWHTRVTTMTEAEFREDLRASRTVLEDVSGQRVLGFRAPSFSIVPGLEWALETLVDEGFMYDSSLFPVRRQGYGYPGVAQDPHRFSLPHGRSILELPMTMAGIGPLRVPASGGGWFRQLPYEITHRAFSQKTAAGTPGIFYIHPWEIDPGQPRMQVPLVTRLRHYRGLDRTRARLERLFAEFRFTSISRGMDTTSGTTSAAATHGVA